MKDVDLCVCTVPANPDSLLECSDVKLKTIELLKQVSSINQSLHSYCTISADCGFFNLLDIFSKFSVLAILHT